MLDNATLKKYHYVRGTRDIHAQVNREGYILNCFTGKWLERCAEMLVTPWLEERIASCSLLRNPLAISPKGEFFELDLLWMVDDQRLWIECKTADY